MERPFAFRKRILCFVLLGMLCFLAACSKQNGKSENVLGKKEPAEDTPWNHGMDAIMETEDGYYTSMMEKQGYASVLCLRYCDKESGMNILLCNKPECVHEHDENCVATYKEIRVIHTALYEGDIYVLGADCEKDATKIQLYKAALDGSAMDVVGTVLSAPLPENIAFWSTAIRLKPAEIYGNIKGDPEYGFILHKGFAYIPYYLRYGQGMAGFRGGGLIRMDLRTGEMKELYSLENANQGVPSNLSAQGDYVWFTLHQRYKGSSTKRYCISKDEIEDFYGIGADAENPQKKKDLLEPILGNQIVYDVTYSLTEKKEPGNVLFLAYDMETGTYLPEETIETQQAFQTIADAFVYEDKIFWGDLYGLYAVDTKTKKMWKLTFPEEQVGIRLKDKWAETYGKNVRYKLSCGKLYLLFWDIKDLRYQAWESLVKTSTGAYRKRVFACPLEDFYQGNGSWTEIFTIESSQEGESFQ